MLGTCLASLGVSSWAPSGIRAGTQEPDPGCHLTITVSCWAILRAVHLLSQSKDLATLVGALLVAHLQGHKRVVTLFGDHLGVIDVPPGPWSHHAHLAGTRTGAHLEADGAMVHGRQEAVLGVIEMSPGTVGCHARLTDTFGGALMTLWPAFMVVSLKFLSRFSKYLTGCPQYSALPQSCPLPPAQAETLEAASYSHSRTGPQGSCHS